MVGWVDIFMVGWVDICGWVVDIGELVSLLL